MPSKINKEDLNWSRSHPRIAIAQEHGMDQHMKPGSMKTFFTFSRVILTLSLEQWVVAGKTQML